MNVRALNAFASLLGLALALQVTGTGWVQAGEPSERDALFADALAHNPKVQAARERVRQALAVRRGLLGFFDPQVSASGGKSDGRTGNDWTTGVGVEVPYRPGFYLGGELQENRLFIRGPDYDHLYQTALKATLRVPLLKDVGFVQWRLRDLEAESQCREAVSQLLTVVQDVRHQLDLRYINALEALSSHSVAKAATERVQKLLAEAEELVRLKATPEYQLANARLEVELAQEDELRALQACEDSRVRLAELTGDLSRRDLKAGAEFLLSWAATADIAEQVPLPQVTANRGDYLLVQSQMATVEFRLRRSRDDLRPDLSFQAEAVWAGEDPDVPLLASGQYLADHNLGGQVRLVLSQPLGKRAERARLSEHKARMAELAESLRDVEVRVQADLEIASRNFVSARGRLDLVSRAVESAQRTLAAEEERFRLGEGRSRNVLDAQKDLTNTIRRQTGTAAILLRAWSDFQFATGYDGPADVSAPTE
jgi:outer membrane protein TolC